MKNLKLIEMKKLLSVVFMAIVFNFGHSQIVYYNDYRSSINDVQWQTVVADLLLTPQQKSQLFALNNRYPTYETWVVVYGKNPDKWKADRYYQIEKIMGKDKYLKFKNKYYKGQNPVAVYNRNKNNDKSSAKSKEKHTNNKGDGNNHGNNGHGNSKKH